MATDRRRFMPPEKDPERWLAAYVSWTFSSRVWASATTDSYEMPCGMEGPGGIAGVGLGWTAAAASGVAAPSTPRPSSTSPPTLQARPGPTLTEP
jgi:hypothetical protein